MSFSTVVEHLWSPVEQLPVTIRSVFPHGACVVFSNEEFTAAIPATNDDTNELADLFEIAATGEIRPDDIALKAYFVKRDELCGEKGYQMCSLLFKQEMSKQRRSEQLASAARLN